MITEIIMPQMGQTMEEGTIVSWVKKEGEPVERGEVYLIINTDKAEIEVEANFTGIIKKILYQEDDTVPVLEVIALAGDPDEPLPDLDKYLAKAPETGKAEEAASVAAVKVGERPAPAVAAAPVASPKLPSGRVTASPRARKLAKSLNVPVQAIRGTGPGGRIIEKDVERVRAEFAGIRISPVARKLAAQKGVDIRRIEGTGPGGRIVKADVERAAAAAATVLPTVAKTEKMSPIRRITAKRLTESKLTAPHYYVTVETDMAEAVALRKKMLPDFERKHNFRFTVTDMVVKAAATALQEFPLVNARAAGDSIEYLREINIGVAVATDEGLIVPVLRDAGGKSLAELAAVARSLVAKARERKLMPDDFVGGTFTVSNMGMLGVDEFCAIINPPESAILAIGRTVEKPVAINGLIGIRPMMNMTMLADHRIVDGALAARFLAFIKEALENPERLMV